MPPPPNRASARWVYLVMKRLAWFGHPATVVATFVPLLVIPFALVGGTATAGEPQPPAATNVLVRGEVIAVVLDQDAESLSGDGGRTWIGRPARDPGSPEPGSPEPGSPESGSSPVPDPATRACLPGEPAHCYRVVPPRLAVDESRDGGNSWKTVWEVSPGREDALRRRAAGMSNRPWHGSSAIAVQRVTDGHVVVAANGEDGIAVRDARGNWRRMGPLDGGFSPDAAIPLGAPGVDLRTEHRVGLFAGLLGFMSGMAVARRHTRRVTGLTGPAYFLTVAGFVLVLPSDTTYIVDIGALMALLGGACALVATILVSTAAIRARVPARTCAALVTIACCTPFAMWALFTGWESGVIDDYPTAGFLAWLVGGIGVGGSVLVGWAGAAQAEEGTEGTEEAPGRRA
ncbi:hypothetical protein [Streptosporangium sp. NPDC002524]|uniref:hypothetical protein n=1 Tax=Streptosporangium sp. NPDC002524 TaxID=3154537 RepID=UPI0033175E91